MTGTKCGVDCTVNTNDTMTKKHFIAIAAAVAEVRQDAARDGLDGPHALDRMAGALANIFADENPHFNRARFLEACAEQPLE